MSRIIEVAIAASAARTASTTFPAPEALVGLPIEAMEIVVSSSAATATPSVVFSFQQPNAYDVQTDVLASTAVTDGASERRLLVGRSVIAAANAGAPCVIGPRWVVKATAGDADSLTYAITVRAIVGA